MISSNIYDLVDSYGEAVYRFCLQLTCNRDDADDLYQDTFVNAIQQSHKIDFTKNPKAYLLSITYFIWKSGQRKRARRHLLAPSVPIEESASLPYVYDLEQSVESRELMRSVNECVHDLSDQYKVPLYLYYTSQLTVAEIAAALKIPVGTVKSRLHRAKIILRNRLEEQGHEEYTLSHE